jgi:hypothetical protein
MKRGPEQDRQVMEMKNDRTDRLTKAVETAILNALGKAGTAVLLILGVIYEPWWTFGMLAAVGAAWGLVKVVVWCYERWTRRASNVVLTVAAAGIVAICIMGLLS